MKKDYRINIMSAFEFDRLIAEIEFEKKDLGVVVSQEKEGGKYYIAAYSMTDNAERAFVELEKKINISIEFDIFVQAITEAKQRLIQLDKPSEIR